MYVYYNIRYFYICNKINLKLKIYSVMASNEIK